MAGIIDYLLFFGISGVQYVFVIAIVFVAIIIYEIYDGIRKKRKRKEL